MRAVAREWAFARAGRVDPRVPTKVDADLADQWAKLGVPVEVDEEEETTEVWRINWRSVMAFLRCETQWRAVAVAVGEGSRLIWLGIDYQSARPVYERRNRAEQQRLFADIQVMEHAALEAMGEMD
ncbi:hypothetical protein EOA37_09705 [Mesorhizobium sp. M2A.F.Ca.ET.015.02.1.1]|uniref:DUF1799 domain-containing protein n=1 Tax=Mesorhizobium sp. M2A.F.Ca.ET.015.02.1.1 TaxID=2496758 RepID=UPI000FCA7F1A|nr:DUF1799 domain-containing protein [Mesorhizobium sp. M2A.F.Ca.ET.015.02.1.1]RUW41526.1 hypothetical protein EOA37_09705 [Mesorhizobium sp. M2A.F.Ca.ET.015.02.1.1]